MNIVNNIEQFNESNIYFTEPIKNNIINNGLFVRILYSTPSFVMNGIHLVFNLSNVVIEKYFNKYKCNFNIDSHLHLINSMRFIEDTIIKKVNIQYKNKIPQYKLYEQIKNGNIKIFTDNINEVNNAVTEINSNYMFVLKIAGIWHTDTHYGITYKFSRVIHPPI